MKDSHGFLDDTLNSILGITHWTVAAHLPLSDDMRESIAGVLCANMPSTKETHLRFMEMADEDLLNEAYRHNISFDEVLTLGK